MNQAPKAAVSPQQRLQTSRRALVQSMASTRLSDDGEPAQETDAGDAHASNLRGLGRLLRRSLRAWWRSHPAHLAIDVAEPLLRRYAQNHPLQLLGLSFTFGAALVLIRPWRFVSTTGLMLTALRSTHLSSWLASFLTPTAEKTAHDSR
jgi:hypothetical protein